MKYDLIFSKEQLLSMYKLKNIVRYNHRIRLKDESVAEHSFFTSLIVLELCKRLKLGPKTMFECAVKALLHDMPETELNDITYDVKLKLNLYPLLKTFEDKYFEQHYPELAWLMNTDDESLPNLIVKYADAMSVLQYTYNEIELGNESMRSIIDDTIPRLTLIEDKIINIMNIQDGIKNENA